MWCSTETLLLSDIPPPLSVEQAIYTTFLRTSQELITTAADPQGSNGNVKKRSLLLVTCSLSNHVHVYIGEDLKVTEPETGL